MIRTRRVPAAVAIAVAVLALALAGCGSSSSSTKVSPAAYVKSVCTAAGGWFGSIESAGRRLQTTVHQSKSLAKVKVAYVAFVDELLHATQQAEQQLKSAGTPSVNDGKKISADVINAFDRAQTGLKQAAKQVRNTPTNNATAFQGAAGGVQQTVQRALQNMASLAPQKSPQLRAAALKDPSCRRLRSLG